MKTIVITIIIWAGFIPYCSIANPTSDTKSKHPTAFELLDRYAENQDKFKSFIVRTESNSTTDITDVTKDGTASHSLYENKCNIELRYKDDGGDFRAYMCPKPVQSAPDEFLVYHRYLWDGKCYIEHHKGPTVDDSDSYISSDKQHIKDNIAIGYPGPGSFLGWLYGDVEPFDSILKQANSISVRSELERVGSGECYVIDANTKHGTYTIWLDPEHGYGIAKADIHKGPKDLRFGRPLEYYVFAPYDISIRNVRFESIEGIWIPMEADFLSVFKGAHNGSSRVSVRNAHQKVTELLLNPDHNALGSFVPDIENGTQACIVEAPEITYKWQEGMKFITDEWDGSIKYVPKNWLILVGVGKPLPKFEGVKLNLSSDQIENKVILLCFFDIEQRPSRNFLRHLSKRVEEFKAKNIVVIAVQSSQISENKLNEWIKKYNIPFPVGIVQGDEEKTKFAWGVRSLPWLILADQQHIIHAEGFSLTELDEKIGAASKK